MKTTVAGTSRGKDAKQLSTEIEAQRRILTEERETKNREREARRKAENRALQAMLKAKGPAVGVRRDSIPNPAPAAGQRRPGPPSPKTSPKNTEDESRERGSSDESRATYVSGPGGKSAAEMLSGSSFGSMSAALGKTDSERARSASTSAQLTVPGSSRERVRSASPSRFREGEMPKYKKVELIGKGANGKVYSAMLLETAQFIAVKQYRLKDEGLDKAVLATFQKEIEVMEDLCHPNIVQYLGSEFRVTDDGQDEEFNIFLELIPGNSLETLLQKTGPLDESIARLYLAQILRGCAYLHENGIVHRDIKCANILVSNQGEIKLTDFGTAKKIRNDTVNGCQTFSGTPFWMAPEVIKNEEYGRKADVWSIGCTLVEMITGKHPWYPLQNAFAVMYHVTNTDSPPEIPPTTSAAAIDFLSLCLQRDPDYRPTVDELLQHEFVQVDL